MKFSVFLSIFVIGIAASNAEQRKSYKNHKVVTFTIENEQQLIELQNIELQAGFVFLDSPEQTKMPIEVVIRPESFPIFEEIALNTNIVYKVTTDDLQSLIDSEKPLKNRKAGFSLDQYNLIEDIYSWMDEIQASHAATATTINIGNSFEGRPLKVMKISTNDINPAVFIEANIHAREWISSATALWLINEFLTSSNGTVRNMVDSITWYILPVTNPDGFKYTHEVNRLWRKTRSDHNLLCRGIDPNRNFAYNWRMGGSSKVACSDTYMGPTPLSERETIALMSFYGSIAYRAEAFISFHSAAQMLLYPMGHTTANDLVPNHQDLHDIAEAAVNALTARYGTPYTYGNTAETIYVASGISPDHAYGIFKTPLAYTYEFRRGVGTPSTFILPPEQIKDNSEEILDSLLAFVAKAKELGYFQIKP